jgi:hypothetical protein
MPTYNFTSCFSLSLSPSLVLAMLGLSVSAGLYQLFSSPFYETKENDKKEELNKKNDDSNEFFSKK